MKGDAKSILGFLATHFDTITAFYRTQKRENVIVKETFFAICESSDPKINSQTLQEYQIVKRNPNGDFEMPIDYDRFVGFLINDFKQTLTDSLENQSKGLVSLFDKLKDTANDSNTIIGVINSIIDLVKTLCADIEKRVEQMMHEQLELKQNKEGKYNHVLKIEKINYWTKNHITPLNAILNHHHSQSIIYYIRSIKRYVSIQKETHSVSQIRYEFDKLNDQLFYADFNLQSQAKRITDTLLPFIDRIKTESIIWSGFVQVLKDTKAKKEISFINVFRKNRFSPYNLDINIAREFEKLKELPPIYAEEPTDLKYEIFWHFDKQHYKAKLLSEAPINNFMLWCYNTINQEFSTVDKDKFFSLTTLIFETDIIAEITTQNVVIELVNFSIIAPLIKIENAIPQIP